MKVGFVNVSKSLIEDANTATDPALFALAHPSSSVILTGSCPDYHRDKEVIEADEESEASSESDDESSVSAAPDSEIKIWSL